MMLALVGLLVLAAQEVSPSGDNIWRLGGFAVALILGATAQYRWGTVPARKDRDDERSERIAAQEREREAYQVTTPALIQANANQLAVLEALQERRGS